MNPTQKPCQSALSDPQISPQAVALAGTMISGGTMEGLCFSEATMKLVTAFSTLSSLQRP